MKRVAQSAKVFSRDWKQIGLQAQQVGTALTKTLTLPIVGLAGTSIKAAMDFESSFAGVRKTVNATEAEFADLAKGMRDLSKTIPVNVNELNKIGESAGQLGIETRHIRGFTETMAKLGVTTDLSADQAATSLARLANITQMPQTEFDRLGSTIVELGNNFATTEAEIVDFGLRIAGAGQIAGLSEHQILAIGAAMSSVGVQAEAGGTAVQKVLNAMTESVATGSKELVVFAKTAGMSAEDFAAAFREDAAGAFAAFVSGLGEQGDAAFTTLDQLKLGNERVIRAFLSLANAGDLLTDTLGTAGRAWEDNTALTEEARKRFETTASQLTVLWNKVKDVGITLGNALLPAIQITIGIIDKLLPVVDGLAKGFATLPTPVQMVGVGLLAVVAAAGPALFIFGQLALAASAVAAAFTRKGLATRGMTAAMNTATVSSTRLGAMLGVTAKSAGLFGAAIAGWSIGAAIRDVELFKGKIRTLSETFEFGAAKWMQWLGLAEKVSDFDLELAISSRRHTKAREAETAAVAEGAAVAEALAAALNAAIPPTEDLSGATETLADSAKTFGDSIAEATERARMSTFVLHRWGHEVMPTASGRAAEFAMELDGWLAPLASATGGVDGLQSTVEELGRAGQHTAAVLAAMGDSAHLGLLVDVAPQAEDALAAFREETDRSRSVFGQFTDGIKGGLSDIIREFGSFDAIINSLMLGIFGPSGIIANLAAQGMAMLLDLVVKGIAKLGGLIKDFFGWVTGLFGGQSPPIDIPWEPGLPDIPLPGGGNRRDIPMPDVGAVHAASGGFVTPQGIRPRGTDTIPAMLTPGELILTRDDQATLGSRVNALHAAANAGGGADIVIHTHTMLRDREIALSVERIRNDELRGRHTLRAG